MSCDCGGHGFCNSGECICYRGWGRVVDLFPKDEYTCDQNFFVIKFLCVVVVVFIVFSLCFKTMFLFLRMMNAIDNAEVQRNHLVYAVASIINEISMLVFTILKGFHPNEYIFGGIKSFGSDLLVVISLASTAIVSDSLVKNFVFFLKKSVKVLSAEDKKKFSNIFLIEKYLVIMPIMIVMLSIFPLFSYGLPNYVEIFNLMFSVGAMSITAVQSIGLFLILSLVTFSLYKTMQASSNAALNPSSSSKQLQTNLNPPSLTAGLSFRKIMNSNKLKDTYTKLNNQKFLALIRFLINLGWIIFTTVPILKRFMTYFFLFQFLILLILSMQVLKSLWNFNKIGIDGIGSSGSRGSRSASKRSGKSVQSVKSLQRSNSRKSLYEVEKVENKSMKRMLSSKKIAVFENENLSEKKEETNLSSKQPRIVTVNPNPNTYDDIESGVMDKKEFQNGSSKQVFKSMSRKNRVQEENDPTFLKHDFLS